MYYYEPGAVLMHSHAHLWQSATLQGLELLVLGTIVWLLTRHRVVVPVAHVVRPGSAARETWLLLGYGLAALVAANAVPRALGWHPFSWHLIGTLDRGTTLATPAEALIWATFNGVVFALVPWVWFSRRNPGSDHCLRSTSPRADSAVIVTVLSIETVVQLLALHPETLELPVRELIPGAAGTFFLYFAGAVLPTAIFLQALLVPRIASLTKHPAVTVAAGGLLYATFHLWDGGFAEYSPMDWLTVLALTYALPGMFKTWLTLRTGNAWAHAWAYHAFAPHALLDTPMIIRVFSE